MDIVAKVCSFTETILDHDHDLILRGRANFERIDFNNDYIVIDELASVAISSTEQFINPSYKKVINMVSTVTLNFYGENGLSNAHKWATIKGLQVGIELQQDLQIQILQVSSVRNLKQLSGSQYGNRWEVEAKVWYNISGEIEINSIIDLEFNFLNNK